MKFNPFKQILNLVVELPINLDCPNEVKGWIETLGTMRGRRLANHLGLRGKNSTRNASNLANYAWNKWTAMGLRLKGETAEALRYEAICDSTYAKLPENLKW